MVMKTARRELLVAGLGLLLAGLGGCQTYVPTTSQTLPSGFYLQHLPQFIPESPQFPLPRELGHQLEAASQPGLPAPLLGPGAAPIAPIAPAPPPAPGVVPAPAPPAVVPVPPPPPGL
jgi:hypothetical protein